MTLLKRVICLCAIATAMIHASAADWFPIKEVNNGHYAISIGGGVVTFPSLTNGAIDLNTTIWGVHLNVMGLGPLHGSDTKVDKWDDKTCFAIHMGYQVPILHCLRVIPMVGYAKVTSGTTDGSNWKSTSNGISNKYTADEATDGLDYGIAAVFNYRKLIVSGTYTRRTIFGSIGIEF